ncbi:putative transmembrane reductase [Acropora cervicornis]|uniref:ascorbate ferrireductase (transmembrane) n=1 Tax=Acropora cervicornis TaxID=6130 RepID=A0AAD9Q355_ACRCE|nr:putative transmembrane reductase [Acropora cervicornis]
MKEDSIECNSPPVVLFSENNRKVERSIVYSMVHIIAVGLPLVVIIIAQPGTTFIMRTILMEKFGFLMIEAILLFSPQSSLILSTPRATKVKFHWILQTSAWIVALLGFAAIYYNKTLNNKPHFKSWHGIMGFSTVVLISLQSLQGVGVLYYKLPFVSKLKPRQMKQLHAVSGSLVFLVACITLGLGFYSNWFTKNAHFTVVYGSLLSCIALAGVVIGQVYTEYGLRKPGRT